MVHAVEHKEEEREQKVASLMERLKAEHAWDEKKHDVFALRRFLRARGWVIDDAEKMWHAMLKWRAELKVDSMLDKAVLTDDRQQRLMHVFPHGLHGVDKVGRPVLIYRMGKIDLSAVAAEFPELVLQKFHIQMYEFIMQVALPACSLEAGKHVDQVTNIFDLAGLGFWAMSKLRALFLPAMSITRDNYPETLGQVVIINAPAMFDNAYTVVKRMLSPETQAKIQVFGKNYQGALDRLIAPSQLPRFLGGTSDAELGDNFGPWSKLIIGHKHLVDGPHSTRISFCGEFRSSSHRHQPHQHLDDGHGDPPHKPAPDSGPLGLKLAPDAGLMGPKPAHDAGPLRRKSVPDAGMVGPKSPQEAGGGVSQPLPEPIARQVARPTQPEGGEQPSNGNVPPVAPPAVAEGRSNAGPPAALTLTIPPVPAPAAPPREGRGSAAAVVPSPFAAAALSGFRPSGGSPPPGRAAGSSGEHSNPFFDACRPVDAPHPTHASPDPTSLDTWLMTGGHAGPSAGLEGLEMQRLHNQFSVASFHTCLSIAESSSLAAYLQRPSMVGFGSSGAGISPISPHTLPTPGHCHPPPAINEEESNGLHTDPSTALSPKFSSSLRRPGEASTSGSRAGDKRGGCVKRCLCCLCP